MKLCFSALALCLLMFLGSIGESAQDKDLVLYYEFDEGAGKLVTDLSRNGFDAEIMGDPDWVDGITLGGLQFTGDIDEYLQINKILPIGSTDSTVAMWLKVPENAAGRVGILLGNYPDDPNSNWELHTLGQMRLWWNNGQVDVRGQYDLRDSDWYHIAFVRDGASQQIRMYIDSILMDEFDALGDDIEFTTLHRIGGDNRGGASPWLQAVIDEFAIFKRALDEDEIFDLMLFTPDIDPDPGNGVAQSEEPILYYDFNAGAGKRVEDLSGNGLHGDISGDPAWVDGVFSNGLEFTGTVNEYVQIDGLLPIGSTDSTLVMWIKVPKNAAGRVGILLGNYLDAPNSNWELHSLGQMRIWWNNGQADVRGTTDLRDNEWHHIAFIRDKENQRFAMYIDAELEQEFDEMPMDDVEFTTRHRVGGDNRGNDSPWLQASIDELALYNRVLDEDEIEDLMGNPDIVSKAVSPAGKLSVTWGQIKSR